MQNWAFCLLYNKFLWDCLFFWNVLWWLSFRARILLDAVILYFRIHHPIRETCILQTSSALRHSCLVFILPGLGFEEAKEKNNTTKRFCSSTKKKQKKMGPSNGVPRWVWTRAQWFSRDLGGYLSMWNNSRIPIENTVIKPEARSTFIKAYSHGIWRDSHV